MKGNRNVLGYEWETVKAVNGVPKYGYVICT